jgi:hypothetical protein
MQTTDVADSKNITEQLESQVIPLATPTAPVFAPEVKETSVPSVVKSESLPSVSKSNRINFKPQISITSHITYDQKTGVIQKKI